MRFGTLPEDIDLSPLRAAAAKLEPLAREAAALRAANHPAPAQLVADLVAAQAEYDYALHLLALKRASARATVEGRPVNAELLRLAAERFETTRVDVKIPTGASAPVPALSGLPRS